MKVTTRSNFRVVIEPRRLGDYGFVRTSDRLGRSPQQIEKEYQERCEEMADQVKRHVDNVGYVGVECDTEEVCSHCGFHWEVSVDDSDPEYPKGTPLCCGRAFEEFKSK